MAADNISTLTLKKDRQLAKLAMAEAKRQGKTVDKTLPYNDPNKITGVLDSTKPAYRDLNVADPTLLPTTYGNTNDPGDLVDNPNIGGLVDGRPWT